MRGKIDSYGMTDIGKVRHANEDQFLIANLHKSMLIQQTSLSYEEHTRLFGGSMGHLLVVADGMGGAAAGERASTIAIDTLANYLLNAMPWFLRLMESHEDDLKEELANALQRCQQQLDKAAEANVAHQGMGTTVTMAYIVWPRLYVVHAGDSRCYLLRDSHLEQITTDHTVAQQLADEGVLKPDEIEQSRFSHVLWNCIGGTESEVWPEVYKSSLQPGDTLLLCSDGLTNGVPDNRIKTIIQQSPRAAQACQLLVDAANGAGGADNTTVVIAHFGNVDNSDEVKEAHAAVDSGKEKQKIVAAM